MAATRFIQLGVRVSNHSSSSSCFNKSKLAPFATRTIRGFSCAGGEIKEKQRPTPAAAAAAATERSIVVVSDEVKWGLSDLIDLLANVRNEGIVVLKKMKMVVKRRRRPIMKKFNFQMVLERGIIDCRFFTMFAVAGSLLSSFLCYLEGCFLMIESYVHYFNSLSHTLNHHHHQGHVVHLLIESLDMFLMGTGMMVLAMGLHAMFVGSRRDAIGLQASWAGMKMVEEAKARIGHALMLMLQVGMIDKFNNIPLVTGMDLAFFAAAVFLSSASVFLLSSLTIFKKQTNDTLTHSYDN